MIIGLDIDDVIFNTSGYIEKILKKANDTELNNIKLDIMRGDFKIPKVKEFLTKYLPLAIDNAEIMEGSSETIKKLRQQGHKIILITARGNKSFPSTEEKNEQALARNNILYDKIIYNCNGKVESCRENKVDVFIDDSPKNCIEVSKELMIPVIGFETQITGEELHKNNINCVKNWAELEKALINISK